MTFLASISLKITQNSMQLLRNYSFLILITNSSMESMEFHGTWSAPISLTRAVPWISVERVVRQFRWHEQFHGITWNLWWANFADMSSSMELYGFQKNLKCANFADTSSFMEFLGTAWNLGCANFDDQSSSMEFYGFSWNSMELRVRQFCWHEQVHGITFDVTKLKPNIIQLRTCQMQCA